ncbi:MAG: YlxM family DNA-binding protein [Acholeplasmataceae bacterium]|jgi:uncharacterized protein
MEILLKKEQLNQLFDLYQSLLTDKQRLYFDLYYQQDYSLHEIAELYDVSRNAVFDHLKKVEDHLLNYEEKLGLYALKTKRQALLDTYQKTKDEAILVALRKLDE